MNKSKIFGWLIILGMLIFGGFSVNAQKMSEENRENWEIVVTDFTKSPEGYGFTINSQGTFGKVETKDNAKTNKRTAKKLKEDDLKEIGGLLRNLNLAQSSSEIVKGKGDYNYPFWSFTIAIGNKFYIMEGEFFSDTKIRVLTNEQKPVYENLKFKLSEIGVVFPKQIALKPSVLLNNQTGFSVPLIPAEQKMVFRFEYWKSNDGFQHKGWYMDESGKVYKYSYDMIKNPQNPNSFDFKFKMLPTLVAEANPEELAKWREVLKKIERGKYTEKQVSNDKGTAMIGGFLPDAESGKYRLVQLASIGDYEGLNDAPEVEELILWLKSVVPAD